MSTLGLLLVIAVAVVALLVLVGVAALLVVVLRSRRVREAPRGTP